MNNRRHGTPASGFVLCLLAAAVFRPAQTAALDVAAATTSVIAGTVTYTGNLGPVSADRPLCVCVYGDQALRVPFGCYLVDSNGGSYTVPTIGTRYLEAFLDPNLNVNLDAGEPFQIYRDKGTVPADPVVGGPTQTAVDFNFGDENLAGTPTVSPTAQSTETPTCSPSDTPTQSPTDTFTAPPTDTFTPAPTETPTPSPTETPTVSAKPTDTPSATPTPTIIAPPCAGDCNANGVVSVNELLSVVGTALGTMALSCTAGDLDEDGVITINEILTAVNRARNGCAMRVEDSLPCQSNRKTDACTLLGTVL